LAFLLGIIDFRGTEYYRLAFFATAITEIIFTALLFIVAGVGLWKMEALGLIVALVVFGARLSIDILWAPMYIIFIEAGAAIYNVA
jgi:hypothetical protein